MVKHALFGWVDEDDPVKKLTKETRYFAKEDAVGFPITFTFKAIK